MFRFRLSGCNAGSYCPVWHKTQLHRVKLIIHGAQRVFHRHFNSKIVRLSIPLITLCFPLLIQRQRYTFTLARRTNQTTFAFQNREELEKAAVNGPVQQTARLGSFVQLQLRAEFQQFFYEYFHGLRILWNLSLFLILSPRLSV